MEKNDGDTSYRSFLGGQRLCQERQAVRATILQPRSASLPRMITRRRYTCWRRRAIPGARRASDAASYSGWNLNTSF